MLLFSIFFAWQVIYFPNIGRTYLELTFDLFGKRVFDKFVGATGQGQSIKQPLRGQYGITLAKQIGIANFYGKFYEKHRRIPADPLQIKELRSSPELLKDEWNRPFVISYYSPNTLVIQSTGPSGKNEVSARRIKFEPSAAEASYQFVGDNLVVVRQFQ
jgi:hypothetical protein